MKQIIQCVPNFSEGRDQAVVEAIVDAAREASSARAIDYSSDSDHNRMVLTLLGSPEEIRLAMEAAAGRAVELIDMRIHGGGHPRIGAVDVIPLVPIAGVTIDDCVGLSREIGRYLAVNLGIPVYFYEHSALLSLRMNLADVRRGGYERLSAGPLEGDLSPDLGPSEVHPTAGATAIGARGPLVAYNVNLDSSDMDAARAIARNIRSGELGRMGVKSIGVWLASRSLAQVSMNVTRPDLVRAVEVYRYIQELAAEVNIHILESEIIGAVRRDWLEGTSPETLKAVGFRESQILDNWL